MKKLNIYIASQIIIGFLLVATSLISILWLTQSLRFIEMITNKGLPLGIFVQMTSCLMPRLFAILSPISIFVAVLFVYNRMQADRELVVIKSAGISPWLCAKPALFVGLIITALAVYINNFATPAAEKKFHELEWQVKNDLSHLIFREGEFTVLEDNLTIFITSHNSDGTVEGIMIIDERKPNIKNTVSAEKGIIIYNDTGPRIILIKGIKQEINNKTLQFSSISFDRYSIDFNISQSKKKRSNSYRSQTLSELLHANKNPNLTAAEAKRFIVEGNRRLLNPLYNLIFAILACVGLLIGKFNRNGQGKIITISILAMVLIESNDLILGNLATKKIYLLSLYYANYIIPALICFYLLFFYNPAWLSRFYKKGTF